MRWARAVLCITAKIAAPLPSGVKGGGTEDAGRSSVAVSITDHLLHLITHRRWSGEWLGGPYHDDAWARLFQRRTATPAHIASITPKGHAPCTKP
jgi:hypothetical protein